MMPGPMLRVDLKLLEWATENQALHLKAISEHKSTLKAARAIGVHPSTIRDSLRRVEKKAAIFGYSPQHDLSRPVAPGQRLKGASTLYRRGEPEPVLQWVKSKEDDEQREAIIRAYIEGLKEEVEPVAPIPKPEHADEDLCTLYTLTDCHVGMKAWAKETGADWDLKIAEETLTKAFEYLVWSSPPSKLGIFNQLGDFLHFDSMEAVTPESKNLLDADSRLAKVIKVAVRILRRTIAAGLMKHEKMIVVVKGGNHDPVGGLWQIELLSVLYENEPRIEVIDDVSPYSAIQHGSNFLGFHHGDLTKNDKLPILFAAKFREIWGKTSRGYIHTGHRHHVEEKEHPGVKVIQHPTIAAPDAYNARSGYISEREMTSITYHSRYGQVARNTVTPEMLQD